MVAFPVLPLVSVNGFTVECLKRTEIRAMLFLTLDRDKKERQEQILNEGENKIETFTFTTVS